MAGGGSFFTILRALAAARARKAVTQMEIAAALNITRQAVTAWESGVALPTADKLFAWARFLGFDLTLVELPESGKPVALIVDVRAKHPSRAAA